MCFLEATPAAGAAPYRDHSPRLTRINGMAARRVPSLWDFHSGETMGAARFAAPDSKKSAQRENVAATDANSRIANVTMKNRLVRGARKKRVSPAPANSQAMLTATTTPVST